MKGTITGEVKSGKLKGKWEFHIGSVGSETTIFHEGKLVQNVRSLTIRADASGPTKFCLVFNEFD